MSEPIFVIQDDDSREEISFSLLPADLQEVYHLAEDALMSLDEPEIYSPKVEPSRSFIALDDVRGNPQRLKLSRITRWERQFKKIAQPDLTSRKDLLNQDGILYIEQTRVRYGSDYLVFDLPLSGFDDLIERAGGRITTREPVSA